MTNSRGKPDPWDVVVVGAGPAGSTAATLLAKAGWKVALLERGRFPRFHVGESLIPATYWPLHRLGLIDSLKQSHFTKKLSVQFVGESGRESQPFYFFETNPHESASTWQVLRSEFDQMLLDNARACGVAVFEETRVLDVLLAGQRATGVRAQRQGEAALDWAARVVVDATGQSSLLARRLGLREPDPVFRMASVWTYDEGAYRDSGIDEGATVILHTQGRRSWFWYIPLARNQVSVGVVGRAAELLAPGRSPGEAFRDHLVRCPAVAARLRAGRRVSDFYVKRDFSYKSRQAAGDGWTLVGDALGFLDPIYSSGVLLALKSGEMAADAIDDALSQNDTSGARLGRWAPAFFAGMERFRKLVYAFYTPGFSFAEFLKAHPQCREKLIDVLVGDVFKDDVDELFQRMGDIRPGAPEAEAAAAGVQGGAATR